MAENS